jgi:diadenosine tetraphosphate (Ap4A) HIT family hydrolase
MQPRDAPKDECFLCHPNDDWIWAESEHYFAMSALGPIVEGMSIVATRSHAKSMFDVSPDLTEQLSSFTCDAKERLASIYNAPIHMTEHGRVGLCEVTRQLHEQHCFHAHRLLFPIKIDLEEVMKNSAIVPIRADSFDQAREVAGHLVEYLYYESPDGEILVGTSENSTPRQFFRTAVANAIGRPELRSWRTHPEYSLVDDAAAKLRTA